MNAPFLLSKGTTSPTHDSGDLATHRGYRRVFRPGRLTFGFIAPIEGYSGAAPTLANHGEMARKADQCGFSVIWLRDVPFYDPSFGDVGQVLDPLVYAGWLAAETKTIAIGTAGIVLPLRDPLIVAKQAVTVDQLLAGRFILGVSTGDRPLEFPAFGREFGNRAARFRDAIDIIRSATESNFPTHQSEFYGRLDGAIDLIPKPFGVRLPVIAVGRAGQSLEWLGSNTDGMIWHQIDFDLVPEIIEAWRRNVPAGVFKPYSYGMFLDLDRDPDAPLFPGRVNRVGRNALINLWRRQEEYGISHVALNLKMSSRPAGEVLDELAEYVLPHFPAEEAKV